LGSFCQFFIVDPAFPSQVAERAELWAGVIGVVLAIRPILHLAAKSLRADFFGSY
jgi:hypothetical protein